MENSISQTPKNILVIRLDVLGDLILSTPFFRNLHENFKNASVVALVREYTSGALKNNPNIDEILVYPEKASLGEKLKFISELSPAFLQNVTSSPSSPAIAPASHVTSSVCCN